MISCQNTGIGVHCTAATLNCHSTAHTSKSSCCAAVGIQRYHCTGRSSAPFIHLHKQIFLFLNPLKTNAGRISRIFLIRVSCHASQDVSLQKEVRWWATVSNCMIQKGRCFPLVPQSLLQRAHLHFVWKIDKCIYKSWEQKQALLSQIKPTANFLLAWNCCLISFCLPCLLLAIPLFLDLYYSITFSYINLLKKGRNPAHIISHATSHKPSKT